MRSNSEPASPLRVLMRMPDLTPGPAKTQDSPEHEEYEQQPLAPLVSVLPSEPPKPHVAHQPATPEELRQPNKFTRALTMLAGVALAVVVLVVLTNRFRNHGSPDDGPMDPAVKNVLGGSPTEITQAPEISFPTETSSPVATHDVPAGEPELMKIERLPATDDGSTAEVSDGQPGVARLDRGIEQPKPQATNDRSRPGLY